MQNTLNAEDAEIRRGTQRRNLCGPLRISASSALKAGRPPLLIAITGGSGSGKTRLAEQLQAALGRQATHLSLDDFYRDRSRLAPARRARLNFDHPRAIDWPRVERALRELLAGRPARVPNYDFRTHSRRGHEKVVSPKPVVLIDGLWLLHRRSLRRLFALRIFIECPTRTRLRRRLARDLRSRGRTAAAVREQFHQTVDPMHARFVAPQWRWADVVLPAGFNQRDAGRLAKLAREWLVAMPHAKAAKDLSGRSASVLGRSNVSARGASCCGNSNLAAPGDGRTPAKPSRLLRPLREAFRGAKVARLPGSVTV